MTQPRIAIVGEAWGEHEARTGIPFFGPSGQELTRMLAEAGIDKGSCLLLNVFNFRPANNDLATLCSRRAEVDRAYADYRTRLAAEFPDISWPERYSWPPLARAGAFLHPEFLKHVGALVVALRKFKPDIVYLLGNTPTWALLGRTGIGKLRGYLYESPYLDGAKVLPTYHPSAILRQYSNRPLVVADFQKGRRLFEDAAAGRTSVPRDLWIEPGIDDLSAWWGQYVTASDTPVAVDIETEGLQITSIGFGVERSAICIPFVRDEPACDGTRNYWPTAELEARALEIVREFLGSKNPKVFQNALYDLQWLWRVWGAPTRGRIEDTMLIHHALQPEMAKDLGFLGAAYTDERAWKDLGRHSQRRKTKKNQFEAQTQQETDDE